MAAAAVEHEQVDRPACWCCGNTFDEQDLSRLGTHPEVAVCTGCAHWLHRRARSAADAGRRTPGCCLDQRAGHERRRPGLAGRRDAAATPGQAPALRSEAIPGAEEGESAGGVGRAAIVADLVACRDDLHHLVATAAPERLRARSNGTAWTNEQLLFHMVFGFLIVRRLLPLVRLISSLPPSVGRGFAGLLNAGRVPFHWVSYAGACGGALVFNHARMGWLCERTVNHLVTSLGVEPEPRLRRGMPFPTSWDPYFEPFMSLADVYAYPVLHYAHHRAQLTLS